MNKRQRKKLEKKRLALWLRDTYEAFPLKIPKEYLQNPKEFDFANGLNCISLPSHLLTQFKKLTSE